MALIQPVEDGKIPVLQANRIPAMTLAMTSSYSCYVQRCSIRIR